MKCGKPLENHEQEYCYDCAHSQHSFERGAALWVHKEPVNVSIYRFKFHNQRRFGRYYAAEMAKKYKELLKKWKVEMLVPIPLYPAKQRRRGYNQAAIVAGELGRELGIAVDTKALKRMKRTKPQKSLNPSERKRNLEHAFFVSGDKREQLEGKTVLLVDDIYTTGSTLNEAAKTLKAAGAEKVFYLTISIGQGN